jgi:CheY-like chemotaxis protein
MNKDYLLSALSHQIRTPLNGIIGYSQLLSQTRLDKNQAGYANSINSCCLQLISLINDIMDFSKLANGKGVVKNECFSLPEIEEEVLYTLGGQLKSKRQKLYFILDKNIPEFIISDKQKIIQILINLVSNANKFSKNDSRVIVNVTNTTENLLQFTVEDNGIGIKPEDQKKLFSPFVQIETALSSTGSGLGLSICKKLVELLGGSISVHSSEGNGSVFTFTIKYNSYDEFEKYVQKNSVLLKDKIILIIDDNLDSRITISETLFDFGMRPIAASSSLEALKMISSKRYNFSTVLLSLSMTDTGGAELSRQIKELDPEIKIVAIGEGYNHHFERVIYKPINTVKLIDTLYKLETKHDISNFQLNDVQPIERSNKTVEILICEDVSYNLEMLVKMLDTMGYKNVDVSRDGEEAVACLSKKHYDILLLDLKIPKINGLGVAEYCKAKGLKTRIAVLTASVSDKDIEKCKEFDIKYFLLKPYGMNNLKIMMNKLINGTNKC